MRKALGACALVAMAAATAGPVQAAGFGIFEQGAKASGMAGAFTAQADDPSALFFNAGGLGLVNKSDFSIGLTYVQGTKAKFTGRGPFPGPTAKGEQELLHQPLPQIYYVAPISSTWKWGIGVNTPFGLTTQWKNPDQFAGRFLSTKAAIRAIDINPSLGFQLSPDIGLGFGAIIRASDVNLRRNAPAINPFTQSVVNVAHIDLKSDFKEGYGWNVGLVDHYNNSFSWGLSYRSKVKVNYTGNAQLFQVSTGNGQLDAAVAAQLPFGRKLPVKTAIDFPDMASLGLAFGLSPDLLLETDFNWTGWKSFDTVDINFTKGDLPNSSVPAHWKDAYNYRAGLRWTTSPTSQWRFGYVYDQTPQPEQAVNPLLPDANRNGITLGWGHTGVHKLDLSLLYLNFAKRTRKKTFTHDAVFLGTYETQAVLLGATYTW
ncbi:MAG: long-chain fatty acid transport protein [Acidobacteriota bacterium]|jgi:long-chain fatty acid transport protein|nr:long-chain fatty acid transport protein [Acidobacteriota bacterium]